MLRRLKIGTRVNLLIAVPLLALLALTMVSYVSLQRASVRGDEYKELKTAEALRSSIVPPTANLLRAWAAVNQLSVLVSSPVNDRTNLEIIDALTDLKSARADYIAAVTDWRARPFDAIIKSAFDKSAAAGDAFFLKVDSELLPAVDARKPPETIAAVHSLGESYAVQQSLISRTLDLVQDQVVAKEASTDQFVSTVTIVLTGAVGALLLIVLLTAFMVRRSIVRPILALSNQARKVADTDLPTAVHQIQSLPADAPMPTVEPFSTGTHDELADLSASFNSVQNAALELAAEQAVARRTVSDNLVNIARRTQSLLGRSLTSLSDMEQTERDPHTLENLFHLDHLSTRMRRNAQSLLVLAGAEQHRLWSVPLPIGDVVRAAFSEIEHYARVELGDVGVASVQGALAPDIAHLLAELLENATTFSPPTTPVMVVGRSLSDGHQLAIIDYGIGMSAEELEEANLALRHYVEFAQSSRLGIDVILAQTAGATGVTAIIKLPSTVLEFRSNDAAADYAAADERHDPAPPAVTEHIVAAAVPVAAVPAEAELAMVGSGAAVPDPDHIVRPIQSAPSLQPIRLPPPNQPPGVTAQSSQSAFAAPPASPAAEHGALTKRVRGAQLPDLGIAAEPNQAFERPAENVRSALASLQRGTELGRQNNE